jgi:hypothetical protein
MARTMALERKRLPSYLGHYMMSRAKEGTQDAYAHDDTVDRARGTRDFQAYSINALQIDAQ